MLTCCIATTYDRTQKRVNVLLTQEERAAVQRIIDKARREVGATLDKGDVVHILLERGIAAYFNEKGAPGK